MAHPAAARADVPRPAATQDVRIDQRVGERVPLELGFTDSAGHRVRLGDYFDGDTPVVLVLAYSRCAMLCSMVLRSTAEAVGASRLTPGTHYRLVTVSIDPRETIRDAGVLKRNALAVANDVAPPSAWAFLVGKERTIRALADSVGFSYEWDERTEQFAHPAVVFVLSGDGRIMAYLEGLQGVGTAFDDAVAAAGRGQASEQASAGVFSQCYRFIAALAQYGGAITLFLQIGALAIFGGVAGLLVRMIQKERRRAQS